ncbi:hypothetical protein Zmor_007938 [Zophobas morio]|uniref:RRM domain-containing protein n=1 Tax=Zophobas morio TaxID=2755281 RepID=A0AA38MP96_9CUCU|nr:hypothetical protein Zmor_007938 [Zophobas morio]
MPQLNTHPTFRSNCQKIHFPNPTIPTPPKGSEVFVGNLPPDIHEDEIIPLFSQCGAIYKLRLMMDFDDCTRGFAFICYHTPEAAAAAVLLLHNHAVKPGVFICVHLSRDKRRLFVGNVPRNASAENIERRLCRVFDGVVRVMVFEEVANPGLNRGYAFVEFQSYVLAAIARKRMAMGGECVWGKRMVADWAFPEPVVHPVILMQVMKFIICLT